MTAGVVRDPTGQRSGRLVAVFFEPVDSYWPLGNLHLEHGVNQLNEEKAQKAIDHGVVRLATQEEVEAYQAQKAAEAARLVSQSVREE